VSYPIVERLGAGDLIAAEGGFWRCENGVWVTDLLVVTDPVAS
jgi:hypothetical protein